MSQSPQRPSDVVAQFPSAGPRGVDEAVSSAREAFVGWRSEPAMARSRAMFAIADDVEREAEELAQLTVREVGKPVVEARAEVARAVAIFRYYSQVILTSSGETYPATDGRAWLMARRHPLGVCALITPWNFPVAIPTWKAAPALAYGNTVILKPAPAASGVAEALTEIVNGHVPKGVFRVVHGAEETGEPLLDHPDVTAVSFTGSAGVGRRVAERAARRGTRCQCEMGGQNASIVLADADLDKAVSIIAYAAMGYAGQKCTATSRIIVESSIYDEFRDRLIATVESLAVVEPESEECQVGPLIDERSRHSAMVAVKGAGGHVLTGGEPLDAEGFYLSPTLVELEHAEGPLAKEEVFAPVAALLRAPSTNSALRLANDVRYGLVAAVFTNELDRAVALADQLEVGLLRVNAATSGVDFHVPFGGVKASSFGPREQGLAARDFYTESRTLLVSP